MGTQMLDFDTDMQTIRDYLQSAVEAQAKLATADTAALDNFQTTVFRASPTDAKPNLGVVFKSRLESIEKVAVTAVKNATRAELGPLVDMLHAVSKKSTAGLTRRPAELHRKERIFERP
jgi:hypothetical protein